MKVFLTTLLLVTGGVALAQDRPSHPPPTEAIEACSGLVEGDACSFEGRQSEQVEGQCVISPEEDLVCAPEGGPPRRR